MADIKLTSGDDTFEQSQANLAEWNTYYGLEGNDTIRAYQGQVVGGPGNDLLLKMVAQEWWRSVTAWYGDSPKGVVVDLEAGTAEDGWGGHDTLVGIHSVTGNGHDDVLKGDTFDNNFAPSGGNDVIDGRGGVDTVGLPWFAPSGSNTFRPVVSIDDLDIQVSIDGRNATVKPANGRGFSLQLTDVEKIQFTAVDGSNMVYALADLIKPQDMAQQSITAGGNLRWNSSASLGTAVQVTYSFVVSPPSTGVGAAGFRAFSAAEQQTVRDVLAQASALTGLTFKEVTESGASIGQIRFGVSQQPDTKGWSWMPNQAGAGDSAGDVWMDADSMVGLSPGSEGYAALIHEIGHALGLRHPVNSDPGDAWPVQGRAVDDRSALTVMSSQSSADGLFRADWGPLDVLALRYLYGGHATSTDDTLYSLGSRQASAQTTLVDDGGNDTLDASALPVGAKLDLQPGHLSSAGLSPTGAAAVDNLSIVATSVIEIAIGTAFDDVLTGNDAENRLTGGLGNDWIDGGKGVDVAVFAGQRTEYEISNAFGKVYVASRDGHSGVDTLLGIERLQFSDQLVSLSSSALAADVRFSVDEDAVLSGTLPIASDLAASAARYAMVTPPQHGNATIGASGAITYTPEADYWGGDTISFDVIGPSGSNRYIGFITVRPVNDGPPVDRDGDYLGIIGQALKGKLPAAADIDHDPLTYSLLTDPAAGVVDMASSGTFSYVPKVGFSGNDSFRFTVSDGMGGSNSYVARITVADAAQTITGTPDNDDLSGNASAEGFMLGAGNDRVTPKGGNDVIDGGDGLDTVVLQRNRAAYTLASHGSWWAVSESGLTDGGDRVSGIERLQCTDRWVALDLDGTQHGGQAAQILRGLFGGNSLKVPLYAGYAVLLLDQGMSYTELVAFALKTEEFWTAAGSTASIHPNDAFVKAVYTNVIGVAPSASELGHYVDLLESGAVTQTALGILACQSSFNSGSADLVGLAAQGLDYVAPPGLG